MTESFQAKIRAYLREVATLHNRDLIERIVAHRNVELQVQGRWPIRYPRNSWAAHPDWDHDPDVFDLAKETECVGSTGHSEAGSIYVVFDIDDIAGHSPTHKKTLTPEALEDARTKVSNLPYAEVRRSKGGRGLHVYCWFAEPIATNNHHAHKQLASRVLAKITADCGLPAAAVDVAGGNAWFHVKGPAPNGFELIKPATTALRLSDLPEAPPPTPREVTRSPVTEEDEEHQRIIDAYQKTRYTLEYDSDLKLYRLHTAGLAEVHGTLGLRGVFQTTSDATEPHKANCYAFTRPGGSFYVVRYKSQSEAPTWTQTTQAGERACLFNVALDLQTAIESVGGTWAGRYGSVSTFGQAQQVASMFGAELHAMSNRYFTFKYLRADTVVVEADYQKGDSPLGWAKGYRKWSVAFQVEPQPRVTRDVSNTLRHLVTPDRVNAGFVVQDSSGSWNWEPIAICSAILCDKHGLSKTEATEAIGAVAQEPFVLVNEPYEAEFLDGRRWNKHGAMLAVGATPGGKHKHYDMIFDHLGEGLDAAAREDEWCQEHKITGADYLRLWAAVLFQKPKWHLPFLFFYSDATESGKSSFHRSLELLFARGAIDATTALNESFNKCLMGATLCYLEERKVETKAAQKIKQLVDSDRMMIRAMQTDAFSIANYTHWVASYNDRNAIPIESRDTRVVVVEVEPLLHDEQIDWKQKMLPALMAERSDFLGTLMQTALPPGCGRLYLPVLETDTKRKICGTSKPGCDADELFSRVVATMAEHSVYHGPSRGLLELLGEGSWSSSPNHLWRYLKGIATQLKDVGIVVERPTTRTLLVKRGEC